MVNYRMLFDLHTHTLFKKEKANGAVSTVSHATGTVMENVAAAYEQGLSAVGISNHGPGHLIYGMPMDNVVTLRGEIEEARRQYPTIDIKLGIEANIINLTGTLDVGAEEFPRFDYIMAGYHYGIFGDDFSRALMIHSGNWLYENAKFLRPYLQKFNGTKEDETLEDQLMRVNTEMTVAALRMNKPKVLTHPGDKGLFDIGRLAEVCVETGTWMEINNYHDSLSVEGLQEAMKYDVMFVIGSDSHSPQNVGKFQKALERAQQAGVPLDRIVNIQVEQRAAAAPAPEAALAADSVSDSAAAPAMVKKEPESGFPPKSGPKPGTKPEEGPKPEPKPEPKLGSKPEPGKTSAETGIGTAKKPEGAMRPEMKRAPDSVAALESKVAAAQETKAAGPICYPIHRDYKYKNIGQAYRQNRNGRGLKQ